MPRLQISVLPIIFILFSGVCSAAESVQDHKSADSGADTENVVVTPRGSVGMVKQLTFLSDENKRLKLEVSELRQTMLDQSAEAVEERRKLVEAEREAAESRRLAAEAEARVLAIKAREAMDTVERIQQEKLAAVEASEAARKTIEERRLAAETEAKSMDHRRLVAESAERKAKLEVEAATLRIQQLQLEENVATAKKIESLNNRLMREAELEATLSNAEVEKERRLSQEAQARLVQAQLDLERYQQESSHKATERQAEIQQRLSEEESARRKSELDYADKLARERSEEELAQRRELEAFKAEEERKTLLAKTQAETEGRIREQLQTEDVRLRTLTAESAAETKKWLAILEQVSTTAGAAAQSFFRDYMLETVAAVVAIVVGYFSVREIAIGLRKIVQTLVGQPSLVRDTSRKSGLWSFLTAWVWCCNRSDGSLVEMTDGVVLQHEILERVVSIARSTRNARKNHAPLRHVMFYGPPGTGKTLVAQKLAKCCGLDYAIMSGGDVAPLGSKAVSEINNIFSWAKSSPRGLILFVDEAEAFLSSRRKSQLSENLKNVLSTILHHTGSQSTNFMLVLATNRPEDLDDAILDRVDDAILFPEPGPLERVALGRLYFYKYISVHSQWSLTATSDKPIPEADTAVPGSACCRKAHARLFIAPDVTASQIDAILHRAEGFSGRQIAKLMLSMQSAAFGGQAAQPTLNLGMMQTALQREMKKMQHAFKAIDSINTRQPSSPQHSDAASSRRTDPHDLEGVSELSTDLEVHPVGRKAAYKAVR